MRALVLGSRGQIGSALVEHLNSLGHTVMSLDMEVDLRHEANIQHVASWIKSSDIVYFLAFDVGGSKYLAEHQASLEFLSNNVRIMENFAKAYLHSGTTPPFIFASSQMSNMTWSQYGVLKRLGEFYTSALGGVNVRFWNVYGNEVDPEKFHVVTDFLRAAMCDEAIFMRTDGREKRQMLHALDAARALEALCVHYDELDKSKYYDITSFVWVDILSIAEIIANMFNVVVVPGETTDDVQRDTGNEPTEAILEFWEPQIGLAEGIKLVADEIERVWSE